MKKSDLNKMLGLIDDDILKEAMPSGKKTRSKASMWLKIVSAAACFLLVFNVILVPAALFMNEKISSLEDELDGKNQIIENIKGDSTHVQNVVQLPVGGDKNILLSSPLLSAPSKYDDIINSMVQVSPSLDSSWLPGDDLGDAMEGETKEEMEGGSGGILEDLENKLEQDSESSDKYEETTDLQVKDVIEGDIIKRSSKYIYYLSGSKLKIYSIDKLNSELVGIYSLDKHIKALNEALKIPEQPKNDNNENLENELEKDIVIDELEEYYHPTSVKEMFLSTDLKTVTVVIENRVSTQNIRDDYLVDAMYEVNDALYCTTLISLNVEDAQDVYLNDITTVFGRYESARLINGEFLLFTKYTPASNELIIPQYNDGEGFKHIPLENIYSPEKYVNGNYLISYKIDGDSYDVCDMFAYASFDGEIYVTQNNIYITREYYDKSIVYGKYAIYATDLAGSANASEGVVVGYGEKTITYKKRVTEILRVDTENGAFEPKSSLTVNGYIKDRYSLHENGEFLYVVTTDSPATKSTVYKDLNGKIKHGLDELVDTSIRGTSANIYVADTSVMVLTSKLERFAPSGETVRSVKYEGHNAYVCTAKQVIDPVFFFDLSDPFNITYSDTGTIPGFSTSLIELGNGELLGIGVDANGSNVKIETYRMGENNEVTIVDTYIIKGSYSTDYKSHFINRENGYIGLGIYDRTQEDRERYVMLKYENGYLTLTFDCALRGDTQTKRAVLVDGYFYLLSNEDFVVLRAN